jgi:hypothetical protein
VTSKTAVLEATSQSMNTRFKTENRKVPNEKLCVNVLDAIYTMTDVWTVNVKPSTISNCFRKGAFVENLGASSAE